MGEISCAGGERSTEGRAEAGGRERAMSMIPERLLEWAVRIAPEKRREWAEAMAAELGYVPGEWTRWQWSLGCCWIVIRECMAGSPEAAIVAAGPKEEAMRKFSMGGAMLAIGVFVVLLLSPMFRQALRIGEGSWTQGDLISQSRLHSMIENARRRKDADLLAWTALRLENPDRLAIAQEAVAMDQRLTWIYYPACEFRGEGPDAACNAMLQKLKEWAPANAVPWLAEAARVRPPGVNQPYDQPPKNAKWEAAMDRAFASPTYDSYRSQRIELERRVYKSEKLDSPMLMLYGLYAHPIPEIADIKWEAKRLSATDPSKVATFASVMERGAQSDIELIVAMGVNGKGGGNEAVRRAWATRGMHWESFAMVSGKVVQFATLALLAGIVMVIGGVVARFARAAKPGVAEIFGVAGAAMIGASSIAIYVAYLPYAQVLERFLRAPVNKVDEGSMAVFGTLYQIPFWAGQRAEFMVCIWMSVVVIGVAMLGWMATRIVSRKAKEA